MNASANSQSHPLPPLVRSFSLYLQAVGRAARTIEHYIDSSALFCEWYANDPRKATRGDIAGWLNWLREEKGYAPASVNNRFRGLQAFYRWLVDEEEVTPNPLAHIPPPQLEETSKDIASREEVRKLLGWLKMPRKRDAAVVAILYDTGMRAGELAGVQMADYDEATGIITIEAGTSKGRRTRQVRLSATARSYVDRYHRSLKTEPRWLVQGIRGQMTASGIYQCVREAFEAADAAKVIQLEGRTIGAHDLRHTSASHLAEDGVIGESDAMQLFGWRKSDMWQLYTKQVRQQAALNAHERASPLDRLSAPPASTQRTPRARGRQTGA